MRARREVLAGLMATVTAFAVARAPAVFGATGTEPPRSRPELRLYYTNPTLVRGGERVLMPVDAVCAAADGTPCRATVRLGVRVGPEPWRLIEAPSGQSLTFDLSDPARRAVRSRASGAVDFFIRADGPGGSSASLGGPDPGRSLRFFVTRDLRPIVLPSIPFGRVAEGTTVLYLPWGSGPGRAGIRLGNESPTLGPSSFDVDDAGRIVVADDVQGRIAVFDGGGVFRQVAIGRGSPVHVAAADGGDLYLLRSTGRDLEASRVPSGASSVSRAPSGRGIVSEVQATGDSVLVRVLPEDAWMSFGPRGSTLASDGTLAAGLPAPDGTQFVRIGREHSIRLGTVVGDRVASAFEIRSEGGLGEVALARPDGEGGYVLVVRVGPDRPDAADQFEAMTLSGRGDLTAFAVSSEAFAAAPPLARFGLDGRGHLLQMTSSPDGMRIVRFELGVAS